MKTYHAKKAVKNLYYFVGAFFCAVAVLVIAVKPLHYASMVENALVYVFVLMLAILTALRPSKCRLLIDKKMLNFYDGLLGHVEVPLKNIRRVEWNPKIRIRLYTDLRGGKKVVRIPNIFSEKDIEEIFKAICSGNHKVEFVCLSGPKDRSEDKTNE